MDIGSLDYIFENKKANTENVSEQAYKKCIEDVTRESAEEKAIYELAKQNAKKVRWKRSFSLLWSSLMKNISCRSNRRNAE